MKLKEALIWVVFAGVAAHTTLWLVHYSVNSFYYRSVDILTTTSKVINQ